MHCDPSARARDRAQREQQERRSRRSRSARSRGRRSRRSPRCQGAGDQAADQRPEDPARRWSRCATGLGPSRAPGRGRSSHQEPSRIQPMIPMRRHPYPEARGARKMPTSRAPARGSLRALAIIFERDAAPGSTRQTRPASAGGTRPLDFNGRTAPRTRKRLRRRAGHRRLDASRPATAPPVAARTSKALLGGRSVRGRRCSRICLEGQLTRRCVGPRPRPSRSPNRLRTRWS